MRLAVPTLLMVLAFTGCSNPVEPQRDTRATRPPNATLATPEGVQSATPARQSLPCPAAAQRELVGRRHRIVGHSFGWPEPLRDPPPRRGARNSRPFPTLDHRYAPVGLLDVLARMGGRARRGLGPVQEPRLVLGWLLSRGRTPAHGRREMPMIGVGVLLGQS